MNKLQYNVTKLIQLNDGIIETCQVLDETKISFFSHVRIFNDGTSFCLSTRPDVVRHSMESGLFKQARYSNENMILTPGFELWLDNEDKYRTNPHYEFLLQNNISNGVTLVSKEVDYVDLFHFASTPKNRTINNFYINNTRKLKSFTEFYQDKSNKIISEASDHAILLIPNWDVEKQLLTHESNEALNKLQSLLQDYAKDSSTTEEVTLQNLDLQIILSLKNSDRKHFIIHRGATRASISRRELQCILLMLKGNNMREVAAILKLSPRTTQNYVDNIKTKLDCKKRSELLHIFLSSQLLEQILE